MPLKRCTLVFTLLLFSCAVLWAQPKDNSPYSRLGLGDPVSQYLGANAGFGGLSAAFQDPLHLNLLNPASNAFLRTAVFEVDFFAQYANLQAGEDNTDIWSGNLQTLALGFPMRNTLNDILDRKTRPVTWGMNLSLQPYTNVGYDIQTRAFTPGVDSTLNVFQGTGGTYKLTWGNGVKYKNLAVGVNLSYFFGKLTNTREVLFQDLGVAYENSFSDEISVQGVLWNLGVQYLLKLKDPDEKGVLVPNGKQFVFGAYGNSATGFKTNSSKLYQAINFTYPDFDTVLNVTDLVQNGRLPTEFNVGIMYEDLNKLRLGLEIGLAQWSQYENEAKPEQLSDTWKIAVGGEFIPDASSYNSYLKRIRYRVGGFYGTDPRSAGESLTNYGLSLGFGLPLVLPRGQTSFVNTALEFGQFGAAGDSGLKETFARLTVGFTLNDNSWFFKRKFN